MANGRMSQATLQPSYESAIGHWRFRINLMAAIRTQREIRQRAPIWLVVLLLTNLVIMAVDARDSVTRPASAQGLGSGPRFSGAKHHLRRERRRDQLHQADR